MEDRLKPLLDMATERWDYAIIWSSNITAASGVPLLRWCDGFHVGCSGERWSHIPFYSVISRYKTTEIFFNFSKTMYYDNEGIAGTALITGSPAWSTVACRKPCHRTLHSLEYGIRTLAYFPLDIGVLELGSIDVLFPANSDVITRVYTVFSFNGGSARLPLVNPNTGNTLVTKSMSPPTVTDEGNHVSTPVTARKRDSNKRERLEHAAVVERRRRKRLEEGFNELRAVVPKVWKMDKPVVLANAVTYINDLSAKLESLESGNKKLRAAIEELRRAGPAVSVKSEEMKIEVNMMGRGEAIRVESGRRGHPAARGLMALREMEVEVVFATVEVVKELMVQEVKVAFEEGMYTKEQPEGFMEN